MSTINGSNKNLYTIVREDIIRQVITNVINPGEKVTSVRQQALALKVNPQTVQKAYNGLIEQGVLVPKRGSGNYLTTDTEVLQNLKNEFIDENIQVFLHFLTDYKVEIDYVIAKLKENDEQNQS